MGFTHMLVLKPSHAGSLTMFPRHLQHVSFQCSRERKWNGKKALLRPLRPHGKGGEQSVRSPSATVGHICGQLSPHCSLMHSAARPVSALCPNLSDCLSHTQKDMQRLVPKTTRRCTFSSLSVPPTTNLHTRTYLSSYPRLFILVGLA